uniref:Uncharacterized protein n=1 Tax=Steinernema glaseri TaxID=37863 RepID=A0A1I7YR68_9BILA
MRPGSTQTRLPVERLARGGQINGPSAGPRRHGHYRILGFVAGARRLDVGRRASGDVLGAEATAAPQHAQGHEKLIAG